jgi:hypothetical protein
MNSIPRLAISLLALSLAGCGGASSPTSSVPPALPPIGRPQADQSVVHGRAVYAVSSEQQSTAMKLFHHFVFANAYAASGTATVSYTNAASTAFSLDVSGFAPTGFSGHVLSLGKVSVASLSDNNLKVCGSSSSKKCNQAVIRVYTLGTVEGFVNTADNYGVPVYAGTLNPASPVGLGSAGSVQVQTHSVGSSKNVMNLADFPTPSYNVSSDFSNAGAGSYFMSFVVEYALLP